MYCDALTAKSSEVVIPGCLTAALVSAFLQLQALHRVQEAHAREGQARRDSAASEDETCTIRVRSSFVTTICAVILC